MTIIQRKNTFKNDSFKEEFIKTFSNGKNRNRHINIDGFTFIYGTHDNTGRVLEKRSCGTLAIPVFSFCYEHFMWLI